MRIRLFIMKPQIGSSLVPSTFQTLLGFMVIVRASTFEIKRTPLPAWHVICMIRARTIMDIRWYTHSHTRTQHGSVQRLLTSKRAAQYQLICSGISKWKLTFLGKSVARTLNSFSRPIIVPSVCRNIVLGICVGEGINIRPMTKTLSGRIEDKSYTFPY